VKRRFATAVALVLGVAALGGCGSSGGAPDRTLTVFAASSLTGTFTELGHRFQTAHPGSRVRFSFGGSSALATQIVQGAPADVFASAAERNMQQVVDAGRAHDPVTFARNRLEIAVEPGNPKRIAALSDLAKPGLRVALCEPTVPCGELARGLLGAEQVTVRPTSSDPDVKAALAKVELGEVDAALVYVTDVRAARGRVDGVRIPAAADPSTAYPIAALGGSKNAALAKQFVDFVLSADGRAVLAAAGFAAP
jgi:molybdate transport system substrate-binding protein